MKSTSTKVGIQASFATFAYLAAIAHEAEQSALVQLIQRRFKQVADKDRQPATWVQVTIRHNCDECISSCAVIRVSLTGLELQGPVHSYLGAASTVFLSTRLCHKLNELAGLRWRQQVILQIRSLTLWNKPVGPYPSNPEVPPQPCDFWKLFIVLAVCRERYESAHTCSYQVPDPSQCPVEISCAADAVVSFLIAINTDLYKPDSPRTELLR